MAHWAVLIGLLLSAADGQGQPKAPLVRLDHIPVAVRDLNRAVANYQALGFAIKPGRAHQGGLQNAHIKFTNGAGLELISAKQPLDKLSAHYVEFLHAGEGPAFVSLHADDEDRVSQALKAAGLAHTRNSHGLEITDPRLDWVFFVKDNRSPTDRPEHFAHRNGAFATREVWVALDDPVPLSRLLTALGARGHQQTMRSPFAAHATVFEVSDQGRIVVVPAKFQQVAGHPLIGVVLAAHAHVAREPIRFAPLQSHGLWVELRPEP